METLFTRHFVNSKYDRWPHIPGYFRPEYTSLGTYSDFFNEIYETTTYTAIQMEQALIKASSMEEWINNLKELYNGEEAKLDKIFSTYYIQD